MWLSPLPGLFSDESTNALTPWPRPMPPAWPGPTNALAGQVPEALARYHVVCPVVPEVDSPVGMPPGTAKPTCRGPAEYRSARHGAGASLRCPLT